MAGRWRSRFIDQVRIYVKGGGGGQGYPSHGGVGGRGGDIYVKASKEATMRDFKTKKRYSAGTGENSRIRALQGSKGSDVTIKVPLGICVTTDEGHNLGDLDQQGQEALVAKGGRGGCHSNNWSGEKGQRRNIKLILKLIADVGLVGFPNAGKSTLLKALSRSQPKIADYPFTTIRPQVGIIGYPDQRQISLADLPGLIEGAHMNYGMGHKFLRHVERTKLLLFMVDVHGFQLSDRHPFRSALETVMLLNQELELYKPELTSKPAILALNKMDMDNAEEYMQHTRQCIQDRNFASIPEELRAKSAIAFEDIIPVSAKEGLGMDLLKQRIRIVIDDYEEKLKEQDQKEKAGHG
ncbi:GTP-binding protein 10-like isoform X2 [Patiria miniata]|uniref:GTP-binding protein 10 n=1 Tax=Patiria miniata TaxID=46514 RepID=A0A913YZD7_PATMI|nr:GTP-binding protein 10-like isoform X2 [Patiria miniata]XP_038044939.1 GTP-binding protein 10-like isoform X2 [Patiria miniata]